MGSVDGLISRGVNGHKSRLKVPAYFRGSVWDGNPCSCIPVLGAFHDWMDVNHPATRSEDEGTICATQANEPFRSLHMVGADRVGDASQRLHFAFARVSASVHFGTDSNYVSFRITELGVGSFKHTL